MVQQVNRATILTTAAAVIGVQLAWMSWRLVSNYGFDGALRLIWEGDHLLPEIREAMDTLDQIENDQLPKKQRKCQALETVLEGASLDSVDGGEVEVDTIVPTKTVVSGKIRTDLSGLSDAVDKLAFKVDSVESHGDAEVRQRKKALSKHLVILMERVDSLISRVQA
jgi:hypothetical protein